MRVKGMFSCIKVARGKGPEQSGIQSKNYDRIGISEDNVVL